MPNDWSQKVSQYIAVCVVQSSVFAWISSIHIDKVVHGWVIGKANYWHKFPSNYKLAQRDFETHIPILKLISLPV